MQSYSSAITFPTVASLTPNGLLTPEGYKFDNKIYINCYFVKFQTHFSKDLLLIGCDIFPQIVVICLHLIIHVILGFNTLVARPVCNPRANLWKVVVKGEIVIFLTSVSS